MTESKFFTKGTMTNINFGARVLTAALSLSLCLLRVSAQSVSGEEGDGVFIDVDSAASECSLPTGAAERVGRTDVDTLLAKALEGGCGAPSWLPSCWEIGGLNLFLPDTREVMHSSMIGAGLANVLDTYLSPYEYTGAEVRIMRETMRMTKLGGGRVSNQSLIDLNGSYLENRAGTAHEWVGGLRYSQSWHYNFRPAADFCYLLGLSASGYAGCVYNTRNGNNPAQAKVDLAVDLSAMAVYRFRLFGKTLTARDQIAVPFLGVAFSPQYGQSYYEIFSLGQYDSNVKVAYFGNMPSLRNLLTLDIPLGDNTLRIGYVAQFNQAVFNHLRYHSYSHDIMIGFVKKFIRK